MNKIIRQLFDDRIKSVFKIDPNIQRFLLNHERKNLCLERLAREIRTAELARPKNCTVFNIAKLRLCVATTADLFARAALENRKKELMSIMEMKRLEEEASKIAIAQNVLEEIKGE